MINIILPISSIVICPRMALTLSTDYQLFKIQKYFFIDQNKLCLKY